MNDRADELTAHLARSASEIGWQVERAQSAETAADYVVEVARSLEAKSVVRSAHLAVDELGLESKLPGTGVDLDLIAAEDSAAGLQKQRAALRKERRESPGFLTSACPYRHRTKRTSAPQPG